MVIKPSDCSQTVPTHVELVLVIEVVMALTHIVPITHNIVMVCRWAECFLEVVSWVVGLLGLGGEMVCELGGGCCISGWGLRDDPCMGEATRCHTKVCLSFSFVAWPSQVGPRDEFMMFCTRQASCKTTKIHPSDDHLPPYRQPMADPIYIHMDYTEYTNRLGKIVQTEDQGKF